LKKDKNVLLICGGGGTEHEISLQSAQYILKKLESISGIKAHYLCIEKNSDRTNLLGQVCELRKAAELYNRETQETVKLDYAIPCIHGPPGENGQLQSVFELMKLPYLGAGPEASLNCFNKITTKLWLSSADIKNAPFTYLYNHDKNSMDRAREFFRKSSNKNVFIKAASQGSSIGCYQCEREEDLEGLIKKAFGFSSHVLIEETIKGRELEVAVFQMNGETTATYPGEITCPGQFYSYEEKYNNESQTETHITARDIESSQVKSIKEIAQHAFEVLKIKDLARIDFFLTSRGDIFLNEINTFPGHTKISMFPLMMEHSGLTYEEFLSDKIHKKNKKLKI